MLPPLDIQPDCDYVLMQYTPFFPFFSYHRIKYAHINCCLAAYHPNSCTCLHCQATSSTDSIHCCLDVASSRSNCSTGVQKKCIASCWTVCGPNPYSPQSCSFIQLSMICCCYATGDLCITATSQSFLMSADAQQLLNFWEQHVFQILACYSHHVWYIQPSKK